MAARRGPGLEEGGQALEEEEGGERQRHPICSQLGGMGVHMMPMVGTPSPHESQTCGIVICLQVTEPDEPWEPDRLLQKIASDMYAEQLALEGADPSSRDDT